MESFDGKSFASDAGSVPEDSNLSAKELQRRMQELMQLGPKGSPEMLLKEFAELASDAVTRCQGLEADKKRHQRESRSAGKHMMEEEHQREELQEALAENEVMVQKVRVLEEQNQNLQDQLNDQSVRVPVAGAPQQAAPAPRESGNLGAGVMGLINQVVSKKKRERLMDELDESEAQRGGMQDRVDALEKENKKAREQIERLQTDLETEKKGGVKWSLNWSNQLEEERAWRRNRVNQHANKIDAHIEDHMDDCYDDIQALNQLKQFDPACGSLAADLDTASTVRSMFQASFVSGGGGVTSFTSNVSGGPAARRKKKKATSFAATPEVVEIEMRAQPKQPAMAEPEAPARQPLIKKAASKIDNDTGKDGKKDTDAESVGDSEGAEIKLHPLLEATDDNELQRKLLRTLHLVQLLQESNSHLKDDVAQLEEHARMFAKVERALMISVAVMSTLIFIIGFWCTTREKKCPACPDCGPPGPMF